MADTLYTHIGGTLVAENDGGTERSYLSDLLGSTQAMADSGQSITDTFDYWPYGEVQSSTGSNDTPFKFAGARGIYDDGDGLLHVQRRHYAPGLGRWAQRDLVAGDWTRYSYCGDDPVNYYDDNGLFRGAPVFAPTGLGQAAEGGAVAGGPVAVIVAGAIALVDLGNWAITGRHGPFTGTGAAIGDYIGDALYPDGAGPTNPEEWQDAWNRLGRPAPPLPGSKPTATVAVDPCTLQAPAPQEEEEPFGHSAPAPNGRDCFSDCKAYCKRATRWITSIRWPDPTWKYDDVSISSGVGEPGTYLQCMDECMAACFMGLSSFRYDGFDEVLEW